MNKDIELQERELINALEFYGITASNIDKAKDIPWLTKENAKYFLKPELRENANRYFSVIKGRQHKLDVIKPYIKQGSEGIGNEIKDSPRKKPAASTAKLTDEDYELYDALTFYGIQFDTLDRARDIVWLKRQYAKTTLSRSDKEIGKHSYEIIKENQGKLKTFKRKFVLIDSEFDKYTNTSSTKIPERESFNDYDDEDDMTAFRRKIKEGIIRTGKKSDSNRINDTIEDIMNDETIDRKPFEGFKKTNPMPQRPEGTGIPDFVWILLFIFVGLPIIFAILT